MKKIIKKPMFQSFIIGIMGGISAFVIMGIKYSMKGSLVDWISAIGTLGAVAVSLWLAKDKKNTSDMLGNCFESTLSYYKNGSEPPISINPKEEIPDYLTWEGSIQFFNPSDFPRTIYNLETHFIFFEKDNVHGFDYFKKTKDLNKKQLHYVTLSPKETKIIFVSQIVKRQEIQDEFNFGEFELKKVYLAGFNEKNRSVKINLFESKTYGTEGTA